MRISVALVIASLAHVHASNDHPLWNAYDNLIKGAKHIDLTHAFQPNQPTFAGFSMASFGPTVAGRDYPAFGYTKGVEFNYEEHGFYTLF